MNATLNIPVRAKKWPLLKKERLGYDGFVNNNIKGGALMVVLQKIKIDSYICGL
jgi:hypothetical protein